MNLSTNIVMWPTISELIGLVLGPSGANKRLKVRLMFEATRWPCKICMEIHLGKETYSFPFHAMLQITH